MPSQLLTNLQQERRLVIEVRDNKLRVVSQRSLLPTAARTFVLRAKRRRFARLYRHDRRFTYYVQDCHGFKLVVDGIERKAKANRIQLRSNVCIDDIQFSLDKGQKCEPLPVIEVSNLSLRLGSTTILRNCNFTVRRGEVVGFMGPSGCGKTTLLKELAGANLHTGGDIRVLNRPMRERYHEFKSRVGYVQQSDQLYGDLTLLETLFFTGKLREVHSFKQQATFILKRLNMTEKGHDTIAQLSGGQKKRAAIAVELLHQPDILLLDEPTSPLDPGSVQLFLNTLRGLAKDLNKAVVMVTHKAADLSVLDTIIFLTASGEQFYHGPKTEFFSFMRQALGIPLTGHVDTDLEAIYNHPRIAKAERKFIREKRGAFSRQSTPQKLSNRYNLLQQFFWLAVRYARTKFPKSSINANGEKIGWHRSIMNYVRQPIIIGSLFFAFPNFNLTSLFLLSLAVIWFGINNAAKEVVGEIPVYQVERQFNVQLDCYLLSKLVVLFLIATGQIALLIGIVMLRFSVLNYGMYPDVFLYAPVTSGLFLMTVSVTATLLGLLLSSAKQRVEQVLSIVPIVLIPQIILSGLVTKPDISLKENLSMLTVGRWAFEGLCRIQDKHAPAQRDTFPNGFVLPTCRSVVVDFPAPQPNDTMLYRTDGAVKTLGSYNNNYRRDGKRAWPFARSVKRVYEIVLLHALLYYLLARFFLLWKDPIPFSRLASKSFLQGYAWCFAACFAMLFFISPTLKKPFDKRKNARLVNRYVLKTQPRKSLVPDSTQSVTQFSQH